MPKTGILKRVGAKLFFMRKIFVFILIVSLFLSCRKIVETQNLRTREINVSIVKGHLFFRTVADYDALLQSKAGKISEFLKSTPMLENFMSYKESKKYFHMQRTIAGCDVPDSLIEDNDDFFSLLDENGIIQIEDYLYRYDYCNEKVWVISSTNAENSVYYNNFLEGNLVSDIVGSFPTYVDVIEAVADNYSTMPDSSMIEGNEIFENEGGVVNELFGFEDKHLEAFYRYVSSTSSAEKFDGKLAYQGFGIYFHFYGKEKFQEPCFFNWCTSTGGPRNWYAKYQYSYIRKGNSTTTTGSGTIYPPSFGGENKVDKEFYSGRRGLKAGGTRFAQWDVGNVLAYHTNIQRNQGTGWVTIFNYTQNPAANVTNYEGPNNNINHYIYLR